MKPRYSKLLPRKRRMKEVKTNDFAGNQEVEVRQKVLVRDNGDFITIYDSRIVGYKTADGKWSSYEPNL